MKSATFLASGSPLQLEQIQKTIDAATKHPDVRIFITFCWDKKKDFYPFRVMLMTFGEEKIEGTPIYIAAYATIYGMMKRAWEISKSLEDFWDD